MAKYRYWDFQEFEKAAAVSSGGRRYAAYRLLPSREGLARDASVDQLVLPVSPHQAASTGVEAEMQATLQAIRAGFNTRKALLNHLGLAPRTLARRLDALVDRGLVERTGPGTSSRQTYRPLTTGKGS